MPVVKPPPNSSPSACALCGGRLERVLLEIREPDRFERHVGVSDRGYVRRWIECAGCGGATNVPPAEAAARVASISEGYYEVDFASGTIAEKFARVMGMPKSESDNAHRVDRILSFLDDGFIGVAVRHATAAGRRWRVLDVGAGTGVFLTRLGERAAERGEKIQAWAVEPDPKAAAHLRTLNDLTVVEQPYSPRPELRDFDLCTLNKTLEHVADPLAFLRSVAAAMAEPGGVLYVEVPHVSTITYRPPNDNILGALHHHLYSVGALSRLTDAAGLVMLQITRVFEPSGKISLAAFLATPATVDRAARGPETA